ncbi:hypothetical protein [uncultured Desulfosarcina sp.]|uniref:hypothetical protein n=1 Tax=uncultured Desulfosarcina sp. TaxID=218289 RepID=UPI0029C8EC89|nr:hypothetical protein [uncultured Desulfosarcina sp.]
MTVHPDRKYRESETPLRWIEIINARIGATAAPSMLERLFQDIRESVSADTGTPVRVVIYRGRFVDGDWSIHLHHETEKPPSGKTTLGIELADILRPMALVDHSIWIEEDGRCASPTKRQMTPFHVPYNP